MFSKTLEENSMTKRTFATQTLATMSLLFILAGCATYKELSPDPELNGKERGYIELTKGDAPFELEQGKKYFMKFPAPEGDNFYLVLVTRAKHEIASTVSPTFDDAPVTSGRITDENPGDDSISVYAIGTKALTYYWVIDTVKFDMRLPMHYRYVPQWRYTFETKYVLYKQTFASNLVGRDVYKAIDKAYSFDRFDFDHALEQLDERMGKLQGLDAELHKIESIFPNTIAGSQDTAYRNWQALRASVEDELRFQTSYASALTLFKKEKDTRGSMTAFFDALPMFTSVLGGKSDLSEGVKEKAADLFLGRLSEVQKYYDGVVRNKTDLRPISPDPPDEPIKALYKACGASVPGDMSLLLQFINRFNAETTALQKAEAKFNDLKSPLQRAGQTINEELFQDILARANDIKQTLKEPQSARMERYGSVPCARALEAAVAKVANRADDLLIMYESARQVATSLDAHAWGAAESRMVDLYEGKGAHEKESFADHRSLLMRRFEETLYQGVKQATVARVDSFVRKNEMVIDDVPGMYADSAFLPVYQLTFSSAGPNDLLSKRKEIEGYLNKLKYESFPETAIKSLYAEFIRNPANRGVDHARAIVEHGKYYRGTDRKVRVMTDECDPTVAKSITAPKEYRKVFALPVSVNKQGVNDYMFRLRLQIPSEAQFPVFDLNIKLPQDLATNARQSQWYESLTLDKKPVKNEGRFRITAPTAENNYESQITPVQMDKGGGNILEVKFKFKGYKVFEVSAMAQVPIIRKN
jgi:hypothetical protein